MSMTKGLCFKPHIPHRVESFPFYCSLHCGSGMVGTVNVAGAGPVIKISINPTTTNFGNVNVGQFLSPHHHPHQPGDLQCDFNRKRWHPVCPIFGSEWRRSLQPDAGPVRDGNRSVFTNGSRHSLRQSLYHAQCHEPDQSHHRCAERDRGCPRHQYLNHSFIRNLWECQRRAVLKPEHHDLESSQFHRSIHWNHRHSRGSILCHHRRRPFQLDTRAIDDRGRSVFTHGSRGSLRQPLYHAQCHEPSLLSPLSH